MITVINGDTNAFRAMAYGTPDKLTMEWCRQRQAEAMHNLDPIVLQNIQAQQGSVFGEIDYTGIARMSKALNNHLDSMWVSDKIVPLKTVAELQTPPPVMIKWIMACPEVRERFHQQQLAGYDEYYVDPEPKKNGEDHYYYRRAVEGIFFETEDDDMVANEWFEDLWSPDDALDIVDQVSIQSTWASMIAAIHEGGSDPTSRFNAQL